MSDFITNASDADLIAEAKNLQQVIAGDPASYGLTAAHATDLGAGITDMETKNDAHVTAQADAKSKTQEKDASRDDLERMIRSILRISKANGADESQLASFGQFTSGSYEPLSNPTRPIGRVDTSQRLRHTISFADEAAPDKKRKPAGTVGCEIWRKVGGTPPTDEKECVYVALDTATPYVSEFDGEDAGKMIHYMLRWALRDGGYSPWSETVSATVAG